MEAAIKKLEQGKVAGLKLIPAKIIQLIKEKRLKWITTMFNTIYRKGMIPKDWLKS